MGQHHDFFFLLAASYAEVFIAARDGVLLCILLQKACFFMYYRRKWLVRNTYFSEVIFTPLGTLNWLASSLRFCFELWWFQVKTWLRCLTSQSCWNIVATDQPSNTLSTWIKLDWLKISLQSFLGPLQPLLLVSIVQGLAEYKFYAKVYPLEDPTLWCLQDSNGASSFKYLFAVL